MRLHQGFPPLLFRYSTYRPLALNDPKLQYSIVRKQKIDSKPGKPLACSESELKLSSGENWWFPAQLTGLDSPALLLLITLMSFDDRV